MVLAGRKNSVTRFNPAVGGTNWSSEQPWQPTHHLSFLRHGQIYQSDVLMLQEWGEAF
jgi:hypothetical protein